jgi:site-specific recombinase XerD
VFGWSATSACQKALKEIDLRWHDLRHEGACRLWRSGVCIRTIQLMLGHTTLQQTQKYLNVTDEELKRERMPGRAGAEGDAHRV